MGILADWFSIINLFYLSFKVMPSSIIYHEMFSGAHSRKDFVLPQTAHCTLCLLCFSPLGRIVSDASPVTSTTFGIWSSCSYKCLLNQKCLVYSGLQTLEGSGRVLITVAFPTYTAQRLVHRDLVEKQVNSSAFVRSQFI